MKTSSRSGRYKKKLVSEAHLQSEAPLITAKLTPFLEYRDQGKISEAEFAAIYLVLYLSTRTPFHWLGSRQSAPVTLTHQLPITMVELKDLGLKFEDSVTKKLSPTLTIGELYQYYAFKSTPRSVNRSILEWSNNSYPLVLMNRIPTPLEVLDQQRQSKRCVTALLKEAQLSKYILGERDPMSFTMHDLIHADHFFHDNNCYQGQMGFYRALWKASSEKVFDQILENDAFKNEFEYVISDMNAYCVHLMKCLKSAILHYSFQGEAIFKKMLSTWEMSEEVKNAFIKLNTEKFQAVEDTLLIQSFFDSFKEDLNILK